MTTHQNLNAIKHHHPHPPQFTRIQRDDKTVVGVKGNIIQNWLFGPLRINNAIDWSVGWWVVNDNIGQTQTEAANVLWWRTIPPSSLSVSSNRGTDNVDFLLGHCIILIPSAGKTNKLSPIVTSFSSVLNLIILQWVRPRTVFFRFGLFPVSFSVTSSCPIPIYGHFFARLAFLLRIPLNEDEDDDDDELLFNCRIMKLINLTLNWSEME